MTPLITTHQDSYTLGLLPCGTITPVGQLHPRAITPIARTTTPKDNYPITGHNLNCTAFTN